MSSESVDTRQMTPMTTLTNHSLSYKLPLSLKKTVSMASDKHSSHLNCNSLSLSLSLSLSVSLSLSLSRERERQRKRERERKLAALSEILFFCFNISNLFENGCIMMPCLLISCQHSGDVCVRTLQCNIMSL